MSGLRVLPLGVGEAFAAKHYTTSLAVEAEGRWLLVDCPHPIRKMLREASESAGLALDLDRIDAAVVTHLHADHSSGLETFGFYSYFALRRRAVLAMHPLASTRLWEGHLAAGMEMPAAHPEAPERSLRLDDYFDLIDLDEARPIQVGPFAIECRRTIHPIPTYALRIRAGGRTLGVSADTAFDTALIDWLADADLIVHEGTPREHAGAHTPIARLAALPEPIRAKIRLIHYPDDLNLDACPIEPLRQGHFGEA